MPGPTAPTRYPPLPPFGSCGPHHHSREPQVLAPRHSTPSPGPQTSRGTGGWGGTGPRTHQPFPRVVGPAGSGCSFLLSSRPGLMEIRAVALSTVAIKGERSVLYLCMGADGKMQGLVGVSTRQDALGRGPAGKGGALDQRQGFLASSAGVPMELGGEGCKGRTKLMSDFLNMEVYGRRMLETRLCIST